MTISLDKATGASEDAVLGLLKREADKGVDLGDVSAQIDLGIDYSGSMGDRYPTEVTDLVTRVLSISLTGLDADEEVPVHFFDHRAFDPIVADRVNYTAIVPTFMQANSMGGTAYLPTMKAMLGPKRKFGSKFDLESEKSKPPNLHIFVTDGVPNDKDQVKKFIIDCSGRPHFWAFLGLGYSLDFLSKIDTMGGRVLDNVSLAVMDSIHDLDDQAFTETILDEWLTQWLPAARQKGITP